MRSKLHRVRMVLWSMLLWSVASYAQVRIDMDHDWRFRTDAADAGLAAGWSAATPAETRLVDVPHTWNIGEDDDYEGVAWYFKSFTAPASMLASHVELHFGATFYRSRVWVNGVEVGGHEGGHTAYALDIGKQLRAGENLIAVRLDNLPGEATIPGYAMRQAGSGSVWYDWWHYGGIVRDVWLTVSDHALIRRQRITSKLGGDAASVSSDVFVENVDGGDSRYSVTASIVDPDGKAVAQAQRDVTASAGQPVAVTLAVNLPHPQLWNVGDARLYQWVTQLHAADGTVLDSRSESFGLRDIVIRDRRLYVNGKPVRLSGVSRHEDSPWEGLAESTGTIRRDWSDMAALHTTLTRPVHYPQNDAVLDFADRHGILLIPEIPVWQFSEAQLKNPKLLALAKAMMREMIEQDGNHASIFAWSVCNESDASMPGGRAYVDAMASLIREIDPGRYVTFADADISIKPWKEAPVMHDVDFIMANAYFGSWSGSGSDVEPWLDFVDRTYPDKMVIISEFGYPGVFSHDSASADKARSENLLQQMDAIQRRSFIAGAIFWTYQDYKSHRNLWAGQTEGYVDHGLVDENRQRRPSYAIYEARNEPLSVATQWEVDAGGLRGFKATVSGYPATHLPSYSMQNYVAHWRAIDDRGHELAHGDEVLRDLAQPVHIEGAWPAAGKGAAVHLLVDIIRPDGVRAGGVASDYHPLNIGSAHFLPNKDEQP
ncbi:glycoside hydrolase family 2 protein [Dyella japonica]|uniref:Beta-galactosidase/beta-glucuronidase n=1 Tax=Dyella japonica TaxID=231455 RepID=A0ABV2JQ34_9GAMM